MGRRSQFWRRRGRWARPTAIASAPLCCYRFSVDGGLGRFMSELSGLGPLGYVWALGGWTSSQPLGPCATAWATPCRPYLTFGAAAAGRRSCVHRINASTSFRLPLDLKPALGLAYARLVVLYCIGQTCGVPKEQGNGGYIPKERRTLLSIAPSMRLRPLYMPARRHIMYHHHLRSVPIWLRPAPQR